MTLGEFLVAHPQATPVLEALRIDFCCGGGRDLDAVLADHRLDPKTFLATIRGLPWGTTAKAVDAATMPTPALIDHIVRVHHGYLRASLAGLAEDATHVARAHGSRDRRLDDLARAVHDLSGALMVHLVDEEQRVFPALVRGQATPDQLGALVADHKGAGELLAQIRRASDDYTVPDWGCSTYGRLIQGLRILEEDLHVHVHLENNVLFPRFGGRDAHRAEG